MDQREKLNEHEENNIKEKDKVNLFELLGFLGNIFTVLTFLSLDYATAKYRGKGTMYTVAYIVIIIMSVFWIFRVFQLMYHSKIVQKLCDFLYGKINNIERREKNQKSIKLGECHQKLKIILLLGFIIVIAVTVHLCVPKTEYYSAVTEVYGIPRGIGEPLSSEERKEKAFWWEIKEYKYWKRLTLTYVEAYRQMELLEEYSTNYNMAFFKPYARVEYKYSRDEDKFREYGQEDYFFAAQENDYRDLEEATYYGSNGKLLMKLNKNGKDKYKIITYSVEDMPQLFQSTLFQMSEDNSQDDKDGQIGEIDMTSQQIELTYNSAGLPQTRRLSAGVNNCYGVNGERYSYDQNKRLTALCYLDTNGAPVCNKLGIMLVTFQYDDDGNLHGIRYYCDEDGMERTEGYNGVFCEKYSYDSDGNLRERKQLNRSENWCYDSNGIYMYKYTYEKGALIQEEYLDFDEKASQDNIFHSGIIRFGQHKSNKGREIHIDFGSAYIQRLSVDSLLKSMKGSEEKTSNIILSEEKDEFNLHKGSRDISENEFELNNSNNKEMDFVRNYASIHYSVDKNNYIVEETYYDKEGNSIYNEKGYAKKHFVYDTNKQVIEEMFYGIDGELCLANGGYAAIRYTYYTDQEGVIKRKEYLGTDKKSTFNRELGYSSISFDRSNQDRNKIVARKYYDVDGKPIRARNKDYAVVEQSYDKSGHLIREAYYDETDAAVCRKDYGVAEILYEYADDGNVIREWYKDVYGRPVNRSDTGYAVIYQEFKEGNLIQKRYAGYQNDTLIAVPDAITGAAMINYTYHNGRIQKEQYFDTVQVPVLRKDTGFCIQEFAYDEKGKNSEMRFYDTEGKLILRKDMGCAVIKYKYNNLGQLNYLHYYDVEEQPIISPMYDCAGIEYGYDTNGNQTDLYYLDLQDNRIVRRDLGVAHIHKEFDTWGNLVKEAYFDADENPAIYNKYGYASYTNKFDNGLVIETRYFDTEGHLVIHSTEGYALTRYDYDNLGRCLTQRFFVDDDEPIISAKYYCAGFAYEYDRNGNTTVVRYLDLNGETTIRQDWGCAEEHSEYDELGNIIRISFFDVAKKPVATKKGYAFIETKYENGNCVERRYLDVYGKLLLCPDIGYAIVSYEYDDFGRCVSELYYDINEKPVINRNSCCAGFQYKYDERGNLTDIMYIGLDGELMVRKDLGFAQIHSEFDSIGNQIKITYLDDQGQTTIGKEGGFAFREYQYECGKCIEGRYYDKKGDLILCTDGGYAIVRYSYDDFGQTKDEFYFDTDEKPVISTKYHCAGMTYEYDKKGYRTDTRYIGTDKAMMIRSDLGYAHLHSEYDEFGHEISASYYDTKENPTIWKQGGNASCQFQYDNGNCVEWRYFDEQGNLVLRSDTGYAIIQFEYDEYGRCTSEAYYDTSEQRIINTNVLCAGIQYEYDEKNNQTGVKYVDTGDRLMIRRDRGYAQVRSEFDDFGNEITVSYLGVNGQPAVWKKGGYATCRKQYENGKHIVSSYFDLQDAPVLRSDVGYSEIKYEYDEYGQCIAEFYYGINGEKVISSEYTCAGRMFSYDQNGNRTDTKFVGLDGNLIYPFTIGYSKRYSQIHSEYDDFGNEIRILYFKEDEELVAFNNEGYSICESQYANGKCIERRYLDKESNLTGMGRYHIAVIKYEYDALGQLSSEAFYDAHEQLFINTQYGSALRKFNYDDKGNCTDIWYIGLNGEVIDREDLGYAHVKMLYDDCGNQIEESYFDANDSAVERKDEGYASCKFTYDKGKCIKKSYFDVQGGLIQRKDTGYAVVEYEYDKYLQCTCIRYYDADEKPVINLENYCAGIANEYDEAGNLTRIWHYNQDWVIEDCEDTGIAMEHMEYDAYGHQISTSYYAVNLDDNVKLQRAVCKDVDYSFVEQIYVKGKLEQIRYYDAEGKLVVPETIGYAVCKFEYNNSEQLIRESHYDTNENLINTREETVAVIEFLRDSSGFIEDIVQYDQDNQLIS